MVSTSQSAITGELCEYKMGIVLWEEKYNKLTVAVRTQSPSADKQSSKIRSIYRPLSKDRENAVVACFLT